MWPACLVLLAIGPLVAASLIAPRTVTELLYRALTFPILLPLFAGGLWGLLRGPQASESTIVHIVQAGLVVLTVVVSSAAWTLGSARRLGLARAFAAAAGVLGLLAASHLLHDDMVARGTGLTPEPKMLAMSVQTVACLLAIGAAGLPPVILLATGQGWTRALGRLEGVWLAVCGAVVVQSAIGVVLVADPAWARPTAWLRWVSVGIIAAIALTTWRQRRGGGGIRLPWGRKNRLNPALLLLLAWGLSLFSTALGLILLRDTSSPL